MRERGKIFLTCGENYANIANDSASAGRSYRFLTILIALFQDLAINPLNPIRKDYRVIMGQD